jgi:hypothetical protein
MDGLQTSASPVPPQNWLPAILPLAAVIHRQPALVVTVTHAEVYPSGCALFVSVRANVITLDEQRFLGGLLTNYAQDDDVGEFTVAIVRDGKRQVAEFLTSKTAGCSTGSMCGVAVSIAGCPTGCPAAYQFLLVTDPLTAARYRHG